MPLVWPTLDDLNEGSSVSPGHGQAHLWRYRSCCQSRQFRRQEEPPIPLTNTVGSSPGRTTQEATHLTPPASKNKTLSAAVKSPSQKPALLWRQVFRTRRKWLQSSSSAALSCGSVELRTCRSVTASTSGATQTSHRAAGCLASSACKHQRLFHPLHLPSLLHTETRLVAQLHLCFKPCILKQFWPTEVYTGSFSCSRAGHGWGSMCWQQAKHSTAGLMAILSVRTLRPLPSTPWWLCCPAVRSRALAGSLLQSCAKARRPPISQ